MRRGRQARSVLIICSIRVDIGNTRNSSSTGTYTRAKRALLEHAAWSTLLVAVSACGASTPTAPTPTTLAVACAATNLIRIGQQTQCTASVTLSNGVVQDQTGAAEWSSSNTSVASVSSTGLITAASAGSTTIRATVQGVSGTQAITVNVLPTAAMTVRITGSTLVVAIQDLSAVVFDVSASTGTGLSYRIAYGDGAIDTNPLTFPDRGTTFSHVYHASGTFAVQLTVTDQQQRQAIANTSVTAMSLTGTWGNVIRNPTNGLTESRFLRLVQGSAQGGYATLTGSYTHPQGNSEPLSGIVDDSGSIRNLALTSGTITFDGNVLDGNGVNGDLSSFKVIATGGSANGLTLTFSRQ